MPRRIEVELTSERGDGTWTWRAAGAREPRGTLDGSLLFEGAKVGDVLRADAEFYLEGIAITAVLPPREQRSDPNRIELLARETQADQLVTTTLAPKRKRMGRRGRQEEGDGPERKRGRIGRRTEGRTERRTEARDKGSEESEAGTPGEARSPRGPRSERQRRPSRPKREAPDPKPKPKRLRPARTHRSAVIAELPEEERPIAEQVLRGGIPAVRQAVEKQNEQLAAAGQPQVKAEPLVAIAERLLPRLRTAEWRDRAEAAVADLEKLDLRDLRSVVVAADSAARDDETRQLAATLREGLARRVEEEHRAWLSELAGTLDQGRTVRALRLSSRPPKAGAPLPAELAARLAQAAAEALGPEVTQERWATVLDALAYSPVRQAVQPASVPEEPSQELLGAVRKLASRIPEIAARFGIELEPAQRGAPGPSTSAAGGGEAAEATRPR